MSKVPVSFKPITPFLRRAEELDRDKNRAESKLVAFYCRQYAMEMGIKLREKNSGSLSAEEEEASTTFLLTLMNDLEEQKTNMPHFSLEEAKGICEAFAIDIFTKADDEDRAGLASKNTARVFYAAGSFLDILKQFGDVSEDILEKTRYCKFKAADILKALKEGRKPTPGAPGEELSSPMTNTVDSSNISLSSIPAAPSFPTEQGEMNLPTAPSTPPAPSATPAQHDAQDNFPNMASCTVTTDNAPPPSYGSSPSSTQASLSYSNAYASNSPVHGDNLSQANQPAANNNSFNQHQYSANSSHFQNQQSSSSFQHQQQQQQPQQQPNQYHQTYARSDISPQSAFAPSSNHGNMANDAPRRTGLRSEDQIADAIELAKFAIAALKTKEVDLAIDRLEKALGCIR